MLKNYIETEYKCILHTYTITRTMIIILKNSFSIIFSFLYCAVVALPYGYLLAYRAIIYRMWLYLGTCESEIFILIESRIE